MTDMKICENQAQSSMNYVWMFLDKMRGNRHHDSIATLATLASLMYLLKNDALRIKYNADWQKDHPFMQIDANFIYMVDPEMLKEWNAHGYETLDLCSTLSTTDPLYDIVTKNLSTLFDKGVSKSVLEIVKDIISGKIHKEQFVWILDNVLKNDKEISMFGQPSEFSALAQKFLDTDGKSIFNPFSGMMSFASTFNGYSQYTGVEINREISELALIRLALSDKNNTSVECASIDTWTDCKYDIIVANPPFGMKIKMLDKYSEGTEDTSTIALRRFEDTTTANGQMFMFVNTSMLTAAAHSSLRQELTQKNYLDAVINLPEGVLPNTSIPVSAIVLKKNRKSGAPIKMIDATQMFTGIKPRVLNVEEIYKAYKECSDRAVSVSNVGIASKLNVWGPSYFQAFAAETFREGDDIKTLSEILIPLRGERRFSETEGRRVKIGNLPSDWTNCILSIDEIPADNPLLNTQKITTPALLLATAGKDLKVGYCEASEAEPIFISPNVNAYHLSDNKIHIGYLCMELSKKFIPTTGIATPHFNQQSLALVKIGFPTFANPDCYEQQNSLYEEAKTERMLSKARELGLQEVIDKMKADYINEVRARKHDMMPHLRQLSSARKNLVYYIDHKEEFSGEEFLVGMKIELNNQAEAIDALSNLLSIFSRESQFGTPEVINIDKYLMENYMDGDKYFFECDTDYEALSNYGFDIPEALYKFDFSKGLKAFRDSRPAYAEGINIYIAQDDLKRLCDNIIFNAIKHGFTDPAREDYSIRTDITVDPKRDMFQIDFINNGNPLPKGMDKLRYGIRTEKAGPTAGTGEGGYLVKSITEHYGGDYDIFCEKSGNEYLTTVRVLLPIYRDNEQ